MNTPKATALATVLSLVFGCSHPIEIVGEGDVLSASGTRNCYYEDFLAGAKSCNENLVVHEYDETYYAVPRDGWEFEQWLNYSHCAGTGNACAFNIPAEAVKTGWGLTMPPLVAVFAKSTPPPPKPVAMYSYQLDAAGGLLNPQPLEGAHLDRKSGYFSFTGAYSKATFWCCQVIGGDEVHMPAVTDDTAPLVLRVDLGALPADSGLERELSAQLFDDNGDYQAPVARWTLQERSVDTVSFDDGGTHTIDYTIPGAVTITNATTVNLVDGARLLSEVTSVYDNPPDYNTLNIHGGEVHGRVFLVWGNRANIYGGDISGDIFNDSAELNIYGGRMTSVIGGNYAGHVIIHGGTVDELVAYQQPAEIHGGNIGKATFHYFPVSVSGGVFSGPVLLIDAYDCRITGGEFQAGVTRSSDGNCRIEGGQFGGPFVYTDHVDRPDESKWTFHGKLQLTDAVKVSENQYQSQISGTLADGTPLSQAITCHAEGLHPEYLGTLCNLVEIVSD